MKEELKFRAWNGSTMNHNIIVGIIAMGWSIGFDKMANIHRKK